MSVKTADHIEELLALVIRFTRARRRVLINNLRRMDQPGFIPRDLAVKEFSEQIHAAITEHVEHHRLILRDNPHVRFGAHGRLQLYPKKDPEAETLLRSDPEGYLRHQTQRLMETGLNERLATKMLNRHVRDTLLRRGSRRTGLGGPRSPLDSTALSDDRMDF